MLDVIKEILSDTSCKIRFNWFYDPDFEVSEWVETFGFPVEGYLEPPTVGPIKITQWKWLEINSFEEKEIGRLIPVKRIDHSLEIESYLNNNNICYSKTEENFRIENPVFEAVV